MMDSFVALLSSKNKFKEQAKFKTYLFAIAKNKVFDYLRKNKDKVYVEFNEEAIHDDKSLEQKILLNERNKQLYSLIDNLSEDYKLVIYLHYFEQLDYSQIGIILKKSRKQVYNLILRAKDRLREMVKKEGLK